MKYFNSDVSFVQAGILCDNWINYEILFMSQTVYNVTLPSQGLYLHTYIMHFHCLSVFRNVPNIC